MNADYRIKKCFSNYTPLSRSFLIKCSFNDSNLNFIKTDAARLDYKLYSLVEFFIMNG